MGAEALARARVLAVADIDHHRRATVFGLQQRQRLADDGREFAITEQYGGFAMVHLPGEQPGIEAGIQCVEHRVQRRHRIVGLDHFRRIGQHRADRAATAHAERTQRGSEPCRSRAGLGPVVATLAVDHRRQIGEYLGAALHETHR